MLLFRSLLFNVAFYVHMIVWLILPDPGAVLPAPDLHPGGAGLGAVLPLADADHRRHEGRVPGLENIPPGGLLVAAKHQSVWETFALLTLFADPAFILKRELMWIPFFGWYAAKARWCRSTAAPRTRRSSGMNGRARGEAEQTAARS